MSGFNPTPAVFHSRINGPNFMSFGNPLHGFHNQFDFYGVEKLGEHIAVAVNAYDKQRALIETLSKTLSAVKTWAEKRCPCENDEPNPCPLCGASVENLEACKAVDQTFPPNIKRDIFAALAAAKEQSA